MNLLSNVLVIKSARADLPADFTGGVINIITKDFPTSEEFSFSVGTSFNPEMHFNDNYLSYEGGRSDFLGFDDGTRKCFSSQYGMPQALENLHCFSF